MAEGEEGEKESSFTGNGDLAEENCTCYSSRCVILSHYGLGCLDSFVSPKFRVHTGHRKLGKL